TNLLLTVRRTKLPQQQPCCCTANLTCPSTYSRFWFFRRPMYPRVGIAVAICFCLLVIACGGGAGSNSTTQSPSPSNTNPSAPPTSSSQPPGGGSSGSGSAAGSTPQSGFVEKKFSLLSS